MSEVLNAEPTTYTICEVESGGDADEHVVFFHHRAHVLHGVGQAVADILAVAQKILPVRFP